MIKNTEWGAIAYLTQSKYGKLGSNSTAPEVGINGCTSYLTGTGATCSDTYDTTAGMKASTTGNIYGVYDMSGGSYEYVMGNYNNLVGSSGFLSFPSLKYYNKYTASTGIKGDATTETKGWYSDDANFPYNTSSFFGRGGSTASTNKAGIFNYYSVGGSAFNSYSSRVVIGV